MCGRFDTTHLTWAEIHAQLSGFGRPVKTASINDMQPSGEVRPTTSQVTARLDQDGEWLVEKMRWGLVPYWRNGKPLKDTTEGAGDGFKLTTFNAKSETCHETSTFREAFRKRRCIVPANAWFEWRGLAAPKPKFRFARQDGGIIWFAGLWDNVSTPDDGDVASFTILTGPSEGVLGEYHDRAPVILEPEDWAIWLDPALSAADVIASVRPHRFDVRAA